MAAGVYPAGSMRILGASALLLISTAAGAREMRPTMGETGWNDAAFVAAGAAGIVVGSFVLRPTGGDRAPLDGLGHRPHSPAVDRAGDVAVVLGLSAGAGLSSLVDRDDRLRGPIITLEGALAASMFVQLGKNLFGVCRPRDWSDVTYTCASSDEAHRSFPSGHTAPLAGMAGAALGLALLPSSPPKAELALAVGSTSIALVVALLRERAGAHSFVDTGTALLLGGLAGFGVAALHLGPTTTTTTSAPLVSFGAAF